MSAARKPIVYFGDAAKAGQRITIKTKRLIAAEVEEENVIVPFVRILDRETARTLPYRRRKFEWKPPLHWGQVKLFASELEFLTEYGNRSNVVVYAGAADGRHIPFLANMFPNHKFMLWDPAPMYRGCLEMPNIECHRELFTDEIATTFAGANVLFISDIRSMPEGFDYGQMTPELDQEIEDDVKRDMEYQKKWYEIIKPVAAMLKFRLPYTPGQSTYLDGDVYFQAFAAETSSESRLIVNPMRHTATDAMYDHEEYENFMYRFNRCTRIQPDTDPLNEPLKELFNPVPCSYDTWALAYIVRKYMAEHDPRPAAEHRPGEIIYHLMHYIGSNFERGYANKKKIHDDHMIANKDVTI